jgi:hypothetical protein
VHQPTQELYIYPIPESLTRSPTWCFHESSMSYIKPLYAMQLESKFRAVIKISTSNFRLRIITWENNTSQFMQDFSEYDSSKILGWCKIVERWHFPNISFVYCALMGLLKVSRIHSTREEKEKKCGIWCIWSTKTRSSSVAFLMPLKVRYWRKPNHMVCALQEESTSMV